MRLSGLFMALALTGGLFAAGASAQEEPDVTSHIVTVDGLAWHYVEAGDGEPVVFIHGLPESWYSWHNQIDALKDTFRVIAIDLKGYGQSDKSDGDYTAANVGEEVLALLDAIGLERFHLVTHDWGTLIGDNLAGSHPERIIHYVRMEGPLLTIDPVNHEQFELFQNQALARLMMRNADGFVRNVYETRTVQPVPEADLERIIAEFSREGVSRAVPRYFRDFEGFEESAAQRAGLYAAMDFPVLLLQADSDPGQPVWYFDGATELFPDAELLWVENSGHFTELEQPAFVSAAIREFLTR